MEWMLNMLQKTAWTRQRIADTYGMTSSQHWTWIINVHSRQKDRESRIRFPRAKDWKSVPNIWLVQLSYKATSGSSNLPVKTCRFWDIALLYRVRYLIVFKYVIMEKEMKKNPAFCSHTPQKASLIHSLGSSKQKFYWKEQFLSPRTTHTHTHTIRKGKKE